MNLSNSVSFYVKTLLYFPMQISPNSRLMDLCQPSTKTHTHTSRLELQISIKMKSKRCIRFVLACVHPYAFELCEICKPFCVCITAGIEKNHLSNLKVPNRCLPQHLMVSRIVVFSLQIEM